MVARHCRSAATRRMARVLDLERGSGHDNVVANARATGEPQLAAVLAASLVGRRRYGWRPGSVTPRNGLGAPDKFPEPFAELVGARGWFRACHTLPPLC
ncbi:hypothetical protein GCM10010424_74040 [Streptomyces lienomycini]